MKATPFKKLIDFFFKLFWTKLNAHFRAFNFLNFFGFFSELKLLKKNYNKKR